MIGIGVVGEGVVGSGVSGDRVLGDGLLGEGVLGDGVLGDGVLGDEVLGDRVLGENTHDSEMSSTAIRSHKESYIIVRHRLGGFYVIQTTSGLCRTLTKHRNRLNSV